MTSPSTTTAILVPSRSAEREARLPNALLVRGASIQSLLGLDASTDNEGSDVISNDTNGFWSTNTQTGAESPENSVS